MGEVGQPGLGQSWDLPSYSGLASGPLCSYGIILPLLWASVSLSVTRLCRLMQLCGHGPWLARAGGWRAGSDHEVLSWTPRTTKPAWPVGHRLEDNPGVRRHLVKKPSRTQAGRGSPGGLAPVLRRKKKKKKLDRRPHEVQGPKGWASVSHLPLLPPARPTPCGPQTLTLGSCLTQVFVELNELTLDRSQEPHWRETARWIKFEEDVEEETERWGKPHVASLSFRSLLELRRTIAHGRDPAGLALGCVPSPPAVEFD